MLKLIHKLYLCLVLMSLVACGAGVVESNKGTSAFKAGDYQTARDLYIGALLEDPNSIYYRYNLAIANTAGERLRDAQKELETIELFYKEREVLESDHQALFKLYFAQAFVYGLVQDTEKALAYYQKALQFQDSLDVKKNIELLITQEKQKSKDGKSSKDKKDGGKKGEKSENKGDKEDSKGDDKDKKEIKGQDEDSLKKKNLSPEEIEQILKEIKNQESKVRGKENQKNKGEKKGKGANGKTW